MEQIARMTVTEAARALGKSRRTVHRMIDAGHFPNTIKAPGYRGAYLLEPADVDALKAQPAGSVVPGEVQPIA